MHHEPEKYETYSFKANKVKIKTEPEDGKKCATLYNSIFANKAISSNFLFT